MLWVPSSSMDLLQKEKSAGMLENMQDAHGCRMVLNAGKQSREEK